MAEPQFRRSLTPVIPNRTLEEEREHRKQRLAGAYRLFARHGFTRGSAGHIEARIGVTEDIEAIRTLRSTYHHLANEGRIAELSGLFSPEAVLSYPGIPALTGRTAIGNFYRGHRVQWTRQFISAHVVHVSGDTAVGTVHLDARPIVENTSHMFAGKFDDEYVRDNQKWMFSRVTLARWFMVPVSISWNGGENSLGSVR